MKFKSNCKNRIRFIDEKKGEVFGFFSFKKYIPKGKTLNFYYFNIKSSVLSYPFMDVNFKITKNEKCKEEIQKDWNRRKEYRMLKNLISSSEEDKNKKRRL